MVVSTFNSSAAVMNIFCIQGHLLYEHFQRNVQIRSHGSYSIKQGPVFSNIHLMHKNSCNFVAITPFSFKVFYPLENYFIGNFVDTRSCE